MFPVQHMFPCTILQTAAAAAQAKPANADLTAAERSGRGNMRSSSSSGNWHE